MGITKGLATIEGKGDSRDLVLEALALEAPLI